MNKPTIKTMHQLRTLHPEFFEQQRSQGYRIESPLLKHGYFIMSFMSAANSEGNRIYSIFRYDEIINTIVYIDTRRNRESAIDFIRSKQRINI